MPESPDLLPDAVPTREPETTPEPEPTPEPGAESGAAGDTETPPAAPARPRVRRGRVAAVVFLIAAVFCLAYPSPELKVEPGPAPELTRALAGDGANPVLAHGGQLHFTTIAVTRLRWISVLRCKLSGCELALGSTSSSDDAAAQAAAEQQMAQAQTDSAAAARALVGGRATHPAAKLEVPTGQIGGPSAGLMMSLADVDALSDGDLTGGRDVAGTGTMGTDGTVGPIAGISDKVVGARRVGATVFFAPVEEAATARAAAPAGLTVVPVATLADAVGWLCAHGGQSTACH